MRSALGIAVLLVLSGVAAGCVTSSPDSSRTASRTILKGTGGSGGQPWVDAVRPLSSLKEIVPFAAASKDGTMLRGHVYLPDSAPPFATVLELSPYWNTAAPYGPSDADVKTVDGRKTMGLWHQPLMDAGFAVALINMRGTGDSDGCFQFGGAPDIEDAYAVIEGLAKQTWSNGRVGMVGLSYPGWSQYLALAAAPPSLRAVVPSSGVIDVHSLVTRNGATLSMGWAVSPLWTAGTGLGVYAIARTSGPNPNPFVPRTGPQHAACPRYGPDFLENLSLMTSGDRTPYWQERDYRAGVKKSHVPIFVTNGLTSGEGHILQFDGLWDMIPTDQKRMMLGQHGHAYPTGVRADFPAMQVAWLDHYLRDGPALVDAGIVEWQDDTKAWHQSDHWPPSGQTITLRLSDKTLVADGGAVKASAQMFQSTYANPGIADCNPVQAVYVSPPLKERVVIAGNLAAILYHTKGSGMCPDASAKEVRRALTALRHAAPGAAGSDFPIAKPTTVTIRGHPVASVVEAGERLVLAVGGDSNELHPEARKPVLTVSTGQGMAGDIQIPTVDGTLAFG
jgi:pimeloyl-ACP methyl ester carboxylesterase